MRLIAFTILLLASASATRAETIRASYYGAETCAHKRVCRTANGEIFRPEGLTAASRTLPFGTRLKVSARGRSVVIRITDRGPFVAGRSLDLSTGAARALGIIGQGVATVTIQKIGR